MSWATKFCSSRSTMANKWEGRRLTRSQSLFRLVTFTFFTAFFLSDLPSSSICSRRHPPPHQASPSPHLLHLIVNQKRGFKRIRLDGARSDFSPRLLCHGSKTGNTEVRRAGEQVDSDSLCKHCTRRRAGERSDMAGNPDDSLGPRHDELLTRFAKSSFCMIV